MGEGQALQQGGELSGVASPQPAMMNNDFGNLHLSGNDFGDNFMQICDDDDFFSSMSPFDA